MYLAVMPDAAAAAFMETFWSGYSGLWDPSKCTEYVFSPDRTPAQMLFYLYGVITDAQHDSMIGDRHFDCPETPSF